MAFMIQEIKKGPGPAKGSSAMKTIALTGAINSQPGT